MNDQGCIKHNHFYYANINSMVIEAMVLVEIATAGSAAEVKTEVTDDLF